jgi:hypothetical protein
MMSPVTSSDHEPSWTEISRMLSEGLRIPLPWREGLGEESNSPFSDGF